MASTELLSAIIVLLLDVGERQRAAIAKMVAAGCLAGSMMITTLTRVAAIRFQQHPRALHKAFVPKPRGAKTELVLMAHDARALENTKQSFFELAEQLASAIQGTVAQFSRRVPATVAAAR